MTFWLVFYGKRLAGFSCELFSAGLFRVEMIEARFASYDFAVFGQL